MTYEQQLIEECHVLSEMISVITPDQISRVKKVREVFRILNKRKIKCENAIKAFKWRPGG